MVSQRRAASPLAVTSSADKARRCVTSRQSNVVGGHRGKQMGDVAPQLGGDASESECDQPADRWVAANCDQHLGDHIGDRGFDEVAARTAASTPAPRRQLRRFAGRPSPRRSRSCARRQGLQRDRIADLESRPPRPPSQAPPCRRAPRCRGRTSRLWPSPRRPVECAPASTAAACGASHRDPTNAAACSAASPSLRPSIGVSPRSRM